MMAAISPFPDLTLDEDTVVAGQRRAALALHAMAAADREWVLDQLPKADRLTLRRLTEELARLGVPQDRQLLELTRQALPAVDAGESVGARRVDPAVGLSRDALVVRVAALPPEIVVQLLLREPVALAARLLAISTWPWKASLMQRLGPVRARRITDHMLMDSVPDVGHQRDEALLRALLRRAEGFHPDDVTEERSKGATLNGLVNRFGTRLGGWIRIWRRATQ
ncbi:hypothetical protein ACKI2N_032280 [Cupriavidus sp. 30B13]|uniref:hypothetical protein n=1 Tax=Cupriavidus sp. 30B13 TaxID=3384241 RepID=UPI003B90CBCC